MGQQADKAGGTAEAGELGIQFGVLSEDGEGFDVSVEVSLALDKLLWIVFELGAHLGIARYALLEGESGLAQPSGVEFVGWWWRRGPRICGSRCISFVHIIQHLGFLRRDTTAEEPTIFIIVILIVRVVRWRSRAIIAVVFFPGWRWCRAGFYVFISGLLVVLLDTRVAAVVAIRSQARRFISLILRRERETMFS